MSFLCKCFYNCCSWCCQCFMDCCRYCIYNSFNVICFGCCCCLTGMAVMLLIIYLYYSVSVNSGVSLETGILEYQDEHEYPMYKREVNYEQQDAYVEDYYNYGEPRNRADEDNILRNKRDNLTSTTTTPNTSKAQTKTANTATLSANKKKPDITNGNASTPETNHGTHDAGEEDLDFKLSQSLVDTVHAEAAKENIKEPLGLCRHNEDVQMPEMNVTLFPLEQAQEIISCINDLLKNQSKKHLCIELNEEMNAFLKWMLLTGESKERRKKLKITAYQDDFLFPSTCGAIAQHDEVFSQNHISPQSGEVPKSPEEPSPQEPSPQGPSPQGALPQGASPQEPSPQELSPHEPGALLESPIETTCAPVNKGKTGKFGGLFGRKGKKNGKT